MVASSSSKSIDNSRIQPYFSYPNGLSDIINSHPMFISNQSITNPDWKKNMKMKMLVPPSQQKSSSLILTPPANLRVTLTLDEAIEHELKHGRELDPNMDRKKLRRTVSNRLSAQRSRMKRSKYVNDLQKTMKDLQEMIPVLTQQIESYKQQRKELLLEYASLQKLVESRSIEVNISEIELQQKRLEICRLKELAKL